MEEATFFENADKYLDGLMNSSEAKAFEALVGTDPEMKKKLKDHTYIRNALQGEGRAELGSLIKNLQTEVDLENSKKGNGTPKGKIRSIKRFLPLLVAASVALLVGVFFFNAGTDEKREDLSQEMSNNLETKGEILWEGEVEVSVLPEEGKFGGPTQTKKEVIIYKSETEYFVEEDGVLRVFLNKMESVNEISIRLRGDELFINDMILRIK